MKLENRLHNLEKRLTNRLYNELVIISLDIDNNIAYYKDERIPYKSEEECNNIKRNLLHRTENREAKMLIVTVVPSV